jgi:hypothetical protein
MSNGSTMLGDLQRLVIDIQADLRQRSEELADVRATLEAEHARAQAQQRTAQGFAAWREDFLTQVAAAWVLACVFVRYLEDNGLIAERWLGSSDTRGRDEARHRHQHYFRERPHDSDREYLQHVFRTVGAIPAASELFAEDRPPLWVVGPSGDMARDILAFWQDPAKGALERTFAAAPGDTRFLGDLYQDLSEDARKKYALLQTPVFVEQFILDRTLTPALAEFGLEAVRLIDPTCGSGHFLLGAFERLFAEWQKRWQHTADVRDTNRVALAQKALDQVHGVDINPYAVAIARFRLIVAAVHACGLVRLREAKAWTLHVHTGDSLYYGRRWTPTTNQVNESLPLPGLEALVNYHGLEDLGAVNEVLSRKYHVVVGNPPYITVKDSALSQTYRERYRTCHRQYSLGVPFTERFFDLCLAPPDGADLFSDASQKRHGAGYVGMITANSFMKREFGKKLIGQFFPRIDLTHVIDTSGAYIPDHDTPTVILFGRNRKPVAEVVRADPGAAADLGGDLGRGGPALPERPGRLPGGGAAAPRRVARSRRRGGARHGRGRLGAGRAGGGGRVRGGLRRGRARRVAGSRCAAGTLPRQQADRARGRPAPGPGWGRGGARAGPGGPAGRPAPPGPGRRDPVRGAGGGAGLPRRADPRRLGAAPGAFRRRAERRPDRPPAGPAARPGGRGGLPGAGLPGVQPRPGRPLP